MSFFSPITERSPVVRSLYGSIYVLLIIGALTMIVPLLVTITGSMSGTYDAKSISFFPKYLVSEQALWDRYVDARYAGSLENFKSAFNEANADFFEPTYPIKEPAGDMLRLWKEFKAEHGPLTINDAGLAFARSAKSGPALETREFRLWLLAQYGNDLSKVNEVLGSSFSRATSIVPPLQSRLFAPDAASPLSKKFFEYLVTTPDNRRLIWDVGNAFRSVFLPRRYETINDYNKEFGTQYSSFSEVPFSATAPEVGREAWASFIKRLLNPAFVELSPSAKAAMAEKGLNPIDYIRLQATPEDLRVVSLDRKFADWAEQKGIKDARIPIAYLAWQDFQEEKGFWRKEFAIQNFVHVIDEVMIQGNGVKNTLILILLSVGGALTVNPLAAYALSRYKLPQSYYILLFFLATIAFPSEVAMIPNFLQLKELGLLNTFGALILPGLVNGFSIFLLKGFFDSLPRELYEAADIDGANEWQVFWGITMNLSKPILAVIALGAFTGAYGAFFFALILAPDPEMWTLMVWVYQLRQESMQAVVYASVLLTAVPTLIIFLFAQNVILRGIVVPTEK